MAFVELFKKQKWFPRQYTDANNVLHWFFLPIAGAFVTYSGLLTVGYVGYYGAAGIGKLLSN